MSQQKQYTMNNPLFEHPADNPFYLFLKKEHFFFDIPHYHKSLEFIYIIKGNNMSLPFFEKDEFSIIGDIEGILIC